VALDITVSEELRHEGIAREFVNRIQNIRKEAGFDVTDKITVEIEENQLISEAVKKYASYIGSQTLATGVTLVKSVTGNGVIEVEIEEVIIKISVRRN
jgi:isoleucyl-tRNA synthetase